MHRRTPTQQPASVSDIELGVAALFLLIILVLTTIIVPALA